MIKKKPEFKFEPESFPSLGGNVKQKVQHENNSLDWAAAAQRGAEAPPPKPKIKPEPKMKLKTIEKNICCDDDDGDYSDDGCVYEEESCSFPAKGGYID
jgi:hypothetical protein